MNRSKGFTLLELLTVIAIIAILAAITFPVMARVKDSGYRSSDASNMNTLRSALSLYAVDQGGYPPAILGYASLYATGPNMGNVVPADQAINFLYPRRIDSLETTRPAYDRVATNLFTTAVWPNQDPRAVGTAPYLDLNGDGIVNAADDTDQSRQGLGPTSTSGSWDGLVTRREPDPLADANSNRVSNIDGWTGDCQEYHLFPLATNPLPAPTSPPCIHAFFYNISGYDVAQVTLPGGSKRFELRYALFWSLDGMTNGNAADDPRQLGYANPPESTVMTWNSYFRDYDNGVPTHTNRDIVLFLGGGAKNKDSFDVNDRSWRITP